MLRLVGGGGTGDRITVVVGAAVVSGAGRVVLVGGAVVVGEVVPRFRADVASMPRSAPLVEVEPHPTTTSRTASAAIRLI
jgi:hypothetical protein